MNNPKDLKYKPFEFYHQKYFRKLNESNCLIEPINLLCGGWFLQTFKQVINKLSTNKSSPLPMYFPSIQSMDLITKNKPLLRQLFVAYDTRGIGRIDACEIYCALVTVSKGSYQMFLKTIVDVFGFQFAGRITRDEFFFFLDSFFRSVPKMLVLKGYAKPTEPNVRLQHEDIDQFIKTIFEGRQEIQRNQIYQYMLKQATLNEFIKYVQKKCNSSAQKFRNETIQRVANEAEIRRCVLDIVQRVAGQFRKNYNSDKMVLEQ